MPRFHINNGARPGVRCPIDEYRTKSGRSSDVLNEAQAIARGRKLVATQSAAPAPLNVLDGAFYPVAASDTTFSIDGQSIPASNPGTILNFTPTGLPAVNEFTMGILFKATNNAFSEARTVDMSWGAPRPQVLMFSNDGEIGDQFVISASSDTTGNNSVWGNCPAGVWHFLLVAFRADGTALARIDGSSAGIFYYPSAGTPSLPATVPISVGRVSDGPTGGSMVIWPVAKNATEMAAIWAATVLPA